MLDQRTDGPRIPFRRLFVFCWITTPCAAFIQQSPCVNIPIHHHAKEHCRLPFSCLSMTTSPPMTPPERLQNLLEAEMNGRRTHTDTPILLPCCYDGLTARLIARSQYFEATFMTGFGASAAHGFPDTQLISFHEMMETCRVVGSALSNVAHELQIDPIPCIADGDTGYGNAINAKRTVWGYAQVGMAGVMIEDQVAPKRCGHVRGKSVVGMAEAVARVRAACDARDEWRRQYGSAPLILARTDALTTDGFDAAVSRCQAFIDAGADMTFLEAPVSVQMMKDYCRLVPGPKLANMLEQGSTPILRPQELREIGYTMAAYPLTLLSASILSMERSLERLYRGEPTDDLIATFEHTKDAVGFGQYGVEEERYRTD